MEKPTNCTCNEPISAFAFKTAKGIEQLVLDRVSQIESDNRELQGMILNFRNVIEASANTSMTETGKQYLQTILYMYEGYFSITTQKHGKIDGNKE